MKRLLWILAIAVVLVAVAAVVWRVVSWPGWNAAPPAFDRPVVTSDILGTWRYEDDYPFRVVVSITFNPDGTFDQTVAPVAATASMPAPLAQKGTWELNGNKLDMHKILMHMEDKWTPYEEDWWEVLESSRNPGHATIFGGTFPDPDVYQQFTRIAPKPQP